GLNELDQRPCGLAEVRGLFGGALACRHRGWIVTHTVVEHRCCALADSQPDTFTALHHICGGGADQRLEPPPIPTRCCQAECSIGGKAVAGRVCNRPNLLNDRCRGRQFTCEQKYYCARAQS